MLAGHEGVPYRPRLAPPRCAPVHRIRAAPSGTLKGLLRGWHLPCSSVPTASAERNSENIAAGASQLSTAAEEVAGEEDLSGEARWRRCRSFRDDAACLTGQVSRTPTDWDLIGAASAFAESGVDQLREALIS